MWVTPERRKTARWSFSSVVWIRLLPLLAMIPWEVIHLSGLLFLYPQNSTNDICILPRPGVKWIYSIRTLWSSLRMNTVVNTKHANRKGYGRTWESHRGTLQEHNIGFLSESRMLVAGFVLLQMLRGAVKWAKRDWWCLTPECDLSHVRWLHGCHNTPIPKWLRISRRLNALSSPIF